MPRFWLTFTPPEPNLSGIIGSEVLQAGAGLRIGGHVVREGAKYHILRTGRREWHSEKPEEILWALRPIQVALGFA